MIRDTSGQDRILQPNLQQRFRLPAFIGLGVLGLSALVWSSLGVDGAEKSLSAGDLRLATLTRGTLVRDVAATGKIVAANAPILYSTEEGVVTLLRNPGDQVAAGDVLAVIDSPQLTNNLKQQQALLAGLESSLERARLNARRDQLKANEALDMAVVDLQAAERESRRGDQLIEKHLIKKIDFEKGKDDLRKAQLLHRHAEQEVALMKDTLSFELKNKALDVQRQQLVVSELTRQVAALNVVAPVAGIIGNWLTEQKARLGASQPIMTVVDLSAFEAELAVPESYADELGLGMAVELSFGDVKIDGQLASISPEVRNREVTARVRFAQDPALKLRQNQRLSARVLLENRPDVLMVKRGAFVASGGGDLAYLVEGDQARRIDVRLGARSMADIEVLAGGAEGDVWVVSSLDEFQGAERVHLRQ